MVAYVPMLLLAGTMSAVGPMNEEDTMMGTWTEGSGGRCPSSNIFEATSTTTDALKIRFSRQYDKDALRTSSGKASNPFISTRTLSWR